MRFPGLPTALRAWDGFVLGKLGPSRGGPGRLAAAISGATRGGVAWHVVSAGLLLTGRPTPRRMAVAGAAAWASASVLVAGLKRITRRRRPQFAAGGPGTRSSSMPSSHAATAFAYGSAAAIQHAGATPLLFASAATAWARLRTRRHFPTDVAVGVTTGLAIGVAVGMLIRRTAGPSSMTLDDRRPHIDGGGRRT